MVGQLWSRSRSKSRSCYEGQKAGWNPRATDVSGALLTALNVFAIDEDGRVETSVARGADSEQQSPPPLKQLLLVFRTMDPTFPVSTSMTVD